MAEPVPNQSSTAFFGIRPRMVSNAVSSVAAASFGDSLHGADTVLPPPSLTDLPRCRPRYFVVMVRGWGEGYRIPPPPGLSRDGGCYRPRRSGKDSYRVNPKPLERPRPRSAPCAGRDIPCARDLPNVVKKHETRDDHNPEY